MVHQETLRTRESVVLGGRGIDRKLDARQVGPGQLGAFGGLDFVFLNLRRPIF